MPKVTAIVLHYKGVDLTIKCLESLACQNFADFDVIVWDNNPSLEQTSSLKSFLDSSPLGIKTRLLSLGKNLGFSGGNNAAFLKAAGNYIFLLNNDTELDPLALGELVKAMDADSKIGICASKMIVHGSQLIDTAGDGFSPFLKGYKRGEGEPAATYNIPEYVFGACAGAALYRRGMLEETGFLDEDYFLLHEDTDMNLRAQLYGWLVRYVPSAEVYHKVSSSIGKTSDLSAYYSLRNSDLLVVKDIPAGVLVVCFPFYAVRTILDFLYFGLKQRKTSTYFRAKIDVLRGLRSALVKRRKIMSERRVSSSYLLKHVFGAIGVGFIIGKMRKIFT